MLGPAQWDLTCVSSLMDFLAASLIKVRFWVILCPINLVGRIRDSISDMAKGLTAQGGMDDLAARAAAIVIMSKPVRQGVLFDCLAGGLLR